MSPDTTFSRRGLLSLAGATALASLAGCTATLPPLGERIDYGRIDVPPAGEADYTDWLPHPSTLRLPDRESVDSDGVAGFLVSRPSAIPDWLGPAVPPLADPARKHLDYMGHPYETLEWTLTTPSNDVVIHGDIDRERITSTLLDTVYEPVGDHRGFELVRRTDRSRVVAISGTHVVTARGDDAIANARTIVDTGSGHGRRYHDHDDNAAALIEATGGRPSVNIGHWTPLAWDSINGRTDVTLEQNPIDGSISLDVDDESVYFIRDALFEAGTVPSEARLRELLERLQWYKEPAHVDIEIQERLVSVEVMYPIDELKARVDGQVVPVVTWRGEYDRSNGTVAIEHVAGPTVEADRLEVDVGDRDIDVGDRRDVVGPGDVITVDLPEQSASDDDKVRLVFVSDDSHTVVFEMDPWGDTDEESSPLRTTEEG